MLEKTDARLVVRVNRAERGGPDSFGLAASHSLVNGALDESYSFRFCLAG